MTGINESLASRLGRSMHFSFRSLLVCAALAIIPTAARAANTYRNAIVDGRLGSSCAIAFAGLETDGYGWSENDLAGYAICDGLSTGVVGNADPSHPVAVASIAVFQHCPTLSGTEGPREVSSAGIFDSFGYVRADVHAYRYDADSENWLECAYDTLASRGYDDDFPSVVNDSIYIPNNCWGLVTTIATVIWNGNPYWSPDKVANIWGGNYLYVP